MERNLLYVGHVMPLSAAWSVALIAILLAAPKVHAAPAAKRTRANIRVAKKTVRPTADAPRHGQRIRAALVVRETNGLGQRLSAYGLRIVKRPGQATAIAGLGGHRTYAVNAEKAARALGMPNAKLSFFRIHAVPRDLPRSGGLRDYMKKATRHFDRFRAENRDPVLRLSSDYGLIVNASGRLVGAWRSVAGRGAMLTGADPNQPVHILR